MEISKGVNSYEITADPGFDIDDFSEQYCRSINIPDTIPVNTVLNHLLGDFIDVTPENMEKINWILSIVATHEPKSFLETQLIIQIIFSHQFSAKMLKKASTQTFPEIAEKYINMSSKLMRAFKSGLETLSKVRRDGKQSFYIEHVHVEKDSQAIIGNVGRGN